MSRYDYDYYSPEVDQDYDSYIDSMIQEQTLREKELEENKDDIH